jgi:uncharacterized membrane protein
MKEFLQGSWLKHPLHPILAHLPMALWPAALVFDLLANLDVGGNAMIRTSFAAILAGLVAALLAAPTGLADWLGIKRDRPAWRIGLYHLALNVVAILLWALNLGLRVDDVDDATSVGSGLVALSVAGTLLLAISGYLGGRMVYDYGISIARHSKEKWQAIAEAGGTRVPSEEG